MNVWIIGSSWERPSVVSWTCFEGYPEEYFLMLGTLYASRFRPPNQSTSAFSPPSHISILLYCGILALCSARLITKSILCYKIPNLVDIFGFRTASDIDISYSTSQAATFRLTQRRRPAMQALYSCPKSDW